MISVPAHTFRRFEVVEENYGFLFTVLGGDRSGGGIEWHPKVMLEGRRNGLYLKKDGTLADTAAGDSKPETEALFSLLNMDKVRAYDNYTVDEMLNVASFNQHRIPAENAFTSAGKFMLHPLSGHEEQKEPFAIISRDYVTLYGYEMDEGGFVPMHRREENQVLINHSGDVLIRFEDENLMPILLGPGDVYDLPKGLGYKPEGIRDTSFT